MGGRAGARVVRPILSFKWSFCCKEGWCVASARGLGVFGKKDCEAAASEKISRRRVRSASRDCCKLAGIFPFSAETRFPAAAMTELVGVTLGFEMYWCLWNTVFETLVARVFIIQNFHAR